MPPKRQKRENQLQVNFENHGFDIPYGPKRGKAEPVRISENAQDLLNDLKNYLNRADRLTDEELDDVISLVGQESILSDLLSLAKKKNEQDFAVYVDSFLDSGDDFDIIEDQHKKLKAEADKLKKEYNDAWKDFNEYKFDGSPEWKGYNSAQSWAKLIFVPEIGPQFNEADFEGYQDALGHVNTWLSKKIDKSKLAQKKAMSEDMNNTNALIGSIIDIYKRGIAFSNARHDNSVEKAEQNLNDLIMPLKDLLRAFSVKMNEKDKTALYTDEDTVGRIGAFFRKRREDLEGHLAIEQQKLKDSRTGDKKAEHGGNVKYITQDIAALRLLGRVLSAFPHHAYEVDEKGEFVRMPDKDKGGYDPLSFHDDFTEYAQEYKIREEKYEAAHKEYEAKSKELDSFESNDFKTYKGKFEKAEAEVKKAYSNLAAAKNKADTLLKAVHARVEFKIEEKRRAEEEAKRIAELAKKSKAEAERLKKQEEDRKKQEESEKKKQEEEAQKKRAEEAAKNAKSKVRKTAAPSGKKIDANIYRRELLRLTKELTSKTYRMGQNNSQGFIQLRDTLTRLLDPKADYSGKDEMPSGEFFENMNGINEACRQYAEDHRAGDLNGNQMLRLKIMSRMMNVLNMAKEGIDPASYEGRKRMLSEKVNNAECIDILKDKKASNENKQKARERMLSYLNIGRSGILISEKNPAFQNYMERFEVKHPNFRDEFDMMQYEYEQKGIDQQNQADAMLKELKKPGAKLLNEIRNPQKAVEKAAEKTI